MCSALRLCNQKYNCKHQITVPCERSLERNTPYDTMRSVSYDFIAIGSQGVNKTTNRAFSLHRLLSPVKLQRVVADTAFSTVEPPLSELTDKAYLFNRINNWTIEYFISRYK